MKIDNVYATVFYYSLGLLILSLFFFPRDFIFPSLFLFVLLLITGILSVTSHYLFALSVKFGEVSSVAPLEYTAFVWTGFLGYFRFGFLDADYLISTTPNIGSKGYPLKKPKNVLIKNRRSISNGDATIFDIK